MPIGGGGAPDLRACIHFAASRHAAASFLGRPCSSHRNLGKSPKTPKKTIPRALRGFLEKESLRQAIQHFLLLYIKKGCSDKTGSPFQKSQKSIKRRAPARRPTLLLAKRKLSDSLASFPTFSFLFSVLPFPINLPFFCARPSIPMQKPMFSKGLSTFFSLLAVVVEMPLREVP